MRVRTALTTLLLCIAARAAAGQCTELASVNRFGTQANRGSGLTSISADGRFVVFISSATNLVSGDSNGQTDVFVRDRATGWVVRASVDSAGFQSDGGSDWPSISADGRYVAFDSWATNLVPGDTNGWTDVFVHDLATGTTTRVSVGTSGAESKKGGWFASISGDGRFVAFESDSAKLVPGDTNGEGDVFVHDRATGVTERVSVDSNGGEANGQSHWASISGDGRFVAFECNGDNLVPGDTNGLVDVFVRDRTAGTTVRASVDSAGVGGSKASEEPAISADGSAVAFRSYASNLVPGDTNACEDIFVHELATGTTTRVSVDSAGAQADSQSWTPSISGDGRRVVFESGATDLVPGDTNVRWDVFMHDRTTGETWLLSWDRQGGSSDGTSGRPVISGDGLWATFFSFATGLVSSDTNGVADIFVRGLASDGAEWRNYGAGVAGRRGVPAFVALGDPVLGLDLTLQVDDSRREDTVALLFLGFADAQIPALDGMILVDSFLILPLSIPYPVLQLSAKLPDDDALCGLSIFLQVLEVDPHASRGVSFTPGLELILGR